MGDHSEYEYTCICRILQCTEPFIENGKYIGAHQGPNYQFGEYISAMCLPGYRLEGPITRRCLGIDGPDHWSEKDSVCVKGNHIVMIMAPPTVVILCVNPCCTPSYSL